jgi:hypothetical protein
VHFRIAKCRHVTVALQPLLIEIHGEGHIDGDDELKVG